MFEPVSEQIFVQGERMALGPNRERGEAGEAFLHRIAIAEKNR